MGWEGGVGCRALFLGGGGQGWNVLGDWELSVSGARSRSNHLEINLQ